MKKLLMVLICVSVLVLAIGTVFATEKSAASTTETKEVGVRAKIDIGDNLTKLLEKLARQIGTTTDKIFPWYVKQQILRGYLFLIIDGTSLLIGVFLMICFYGKADWKDSNQYTVLSKIGILICCLAFIFGVFGTSNAITQICNPEYHAFQNLVNDMALLVGNR